MNRPTSIYLISDNALTAEAMGMALEAEGHLWLEGVLAGFDSALESLPELGAEVTLIDTTHAYESALELAREISDRYPDVRLLPLGLTSARQVVSFLEAGASGYAMQDDSLDAVVATIAAVAEGRPTCSPRITAMVFERLVELSREERSCPPPQPPQVLSDRESQVLQLLARGLRNKEIAQRLGIALSTAGNHVQKVLDKLEVHRRRDAIRRAYEQGLLQGSPSLSPV